MSKPSIIPVGYRVLIEPESGEKTTESGIVIPQRERIEQETGTIVSVGPLAWQDHADGTHWANEGDRVVYAKYGGKMVKDPDTGIDYRLVNDEDVLCVVNSEKAVSQEDY
jgi:chaperonin GroES